MEDLLLYTHSDIRWIKSVTRNQGESWAYMEYNIGDTFPLNFSKNPKWYPTNYLKAEPREIIALFQSLKTSKDEPGGWYVTHLVAPVDNRLGKVDLASHPYTRTVALVAKSSNPVLLDHDQWSLYKCSRGQVCNIKTIERRSGKDFSIQEKQKFIWNLFDRIDPDLINSIPLNENDLFDYDDKGEEEGADRTLHRLHKLKERKPGIIKKAKEKAIREHRLFCEVCLFDFEKEYPELGKGFIECHHKQPIAKGGVRKTKIEDLAIVCANCHRMLHKRDKNGNYLQVEDLRMLINKM
ncbi:hypothetical protein GCM10022217_01260 [Chryseobacterium ginsenosidimutans]|uniref:HNH endonuclease n=1 Tax=Chryseobacterium ginsenosidimutans TaxID=687846 RepID=UPI0031D6ECF5